MSSNKTIARRDLYQRYSLASIRIDGKQGEFEDPQLVLKDSVPSRRLKTSHRLLMVHVKDKAVELESIDLETTFGVAPVSKSSGLLNTINYSEPESSLTLRYSRGNMAVNQTRTLHISFRSRQDFDQVLCQMKGLKLNVYDTQCAQTSAMLGLNPPFPDRPLQCTPPPPPRPTSTIGLPEHLSEGWYKVTKVRSASSTPVNPPVTLSLHPAATPIATSEDHKEKRIEERRVEEKRAVVEAGVENRVFDYIARVNQDSLAEALRIYTDLQDRCSRDVDQIVDESERLKIYQLYAKQWETRIHGLEAIAKGKMRETLVQRR